jgi:hypothetical protein
MIHVEVASHFNEDAFSYGLAQGLADRIRRELQNVRCSAHGEEATVRLSTEGTAQTLNDISVEIRGCCEPVIDQLRQLIEEIRERS